jgi:YggT family protein
MRLIFNLLSGITSLYLLLIFVRIILTWFSIARDSKPVAVLSAITDPYLDWFRRFPALTLGGFLDVSPVVAMAVLSILNNIFMSLAHYGSITIGFVLALVIGSLWSAVSFLLGFAVIALGLQLFACLTGQNAASPFWRVVDAISQPLISRVNGFFYSGKGVEYKTSVITALIVFAALWLGGGVIIRVASALLLYLPI